MDLLQESSGNHGFLPSLGQGNQFKTIIESVPAGILMVNSDGLVVLCNAELERMFGYSPGEIDGILLEQLVPGRYRQNHPGYRKSFMQHPSKRQMGAGRELTALCKDGREIPVEIGLNHIEIDGEHYAIASVVDITERQNIATRLQQAYEELQQKNQEMEQFVYTVSHDLKAPLVTSSSFIEFIREDFKEGRLSDLPDSIDRLEKAHKRMQELINDLLHLSRAGRMELQLAEVSSGEILNEVLDALAERLQAKKVNVIVPEEMPKIIGDRKRLYQVFENIFTNALKYASDGENPEMRILIEDLPNEIKIGFKDNGPGIAPAYHRKVFGLFQRLDTTKEGTGVGLAIVSRIMQLHGGRAWLESDEGKGALFWLSFPKLFRGRIREEEHGSY